MPLNWKPGEKVIITSTKNFGGDGYAWQMIALENVLDFYLAKKEI